MYFTWKFSRYNLWFCKKWQKPPLAKMDGTWLKITEKKFRVSNKQIARFDNGEIFKQ